MMQSWALLPNYCVIDSLLEADDRRNLSSEANTSSNGKQGHKVEGSMSTSLSALLRAIPVLERHGIVLN